MPRFSGKIDILKFDKDGYRRDMKRFMQGELREAARRFLLAAYPSVPVRTGFARGSFLKLADKIGESIPISPKTIKPEYYTHFDKSKTLKTPSNSSRFTNLKINNSSATPSILFSVNISYFDFNDNVANNSSPTSPWGSFEKGRQAFINYLEGAKARIPKIEKYLIKTEVAFGRGGARTKVSRQRTIS